MERSCKMLSLIEWLQCLPRAWPKVARWRLLMPAALPGQVTTPCLLSCIAIWGMWSNLVPRLTRVLGSADLLHGKLPAQIKYPSKPSNLPFVSVALLSCHCSSFTLLTTLNPSPSPSHSRFPQSSLQNEVLSITVSSSSDSTAIRNSRSTNMAILNR